MKKTPHPSARRATWRAVALVACLLPCAALRADPTVFGLTLGSTTETEFGSAYPDAEPIGTSKFSDGPMYRIPPAKLGMDGVRDSLAIFDDAGSLVLFQLTMPKGRFSYVQDLLDDRYDVVERGGRGLSRRTRYRDGDSTIDLNAPHMSFTLTLTYSRNAFDAEYERRSREEKEAEAAEDGSRL